MAPTQLLHHHVCMVELLPQSHRVVPFRSVVDVVFAFGLVLVLLFVHPTPFINIKGNLNIIGSPTHIIL